MWPGLDGDSVRSALGFPALMDRYLERKLEEQKPDLPYQVEDTHRWLRFIAGTQKALFRADELDWGDVPERDDASGKPVRRRQQFIPACALAALGGIFAAQVSGSPVDWADVVIGVTAGFSVAVWKEDSFDLRPRLRVNWRDVADPAAIRRGAIRGAKIASISVAVIVGLLLAGTVYGHVRGGIDRRLYSVQWWGDGATPAEDAGQVALVIVGAPAAGLLLGVLFTVIGRFFRSAAGTDHDTASTRRALRSAASGVQMTTAAWSLFLAMGAFDQIDGRGIIIREGLGYKFRHGLIQDYVRQLRD